MMGGRKKAQDIYVRNDKCEGVKFLRLQESRRREKKTPGVTEKGLEGLEDVRERGGDMEGAEGC